MLNNFVRTIDIEAIYPDILSFHRNRGNGNDDLSFQATIDRAFQTMMSDFQQRGKNPRLMMVPVDLNRDAGSTMLQYLKSSTLSGNENGYAWVGIKGREGRFSVNVASRGAGTEWEITVQGSNESERPADGSAYWVDVCSLTIADDDTGGERNVTFLTKYRWYRRVVTLTAGAGIMAFTAALHETTFDDLVINKAIELICTGVSTGMSPMWSMRAELARANYDDGMKALQYTVDENEDGSPEGDETMTGGIELWR